MAGPQLVVPVLNARFLLNAANARWGSLYDAFYGTDALDAPPAKPGGYDPERGDAVIAEAKRFLDEAIPLANGRWSELGDPAPAFRLPMKTSMSARPKRAGCSATTACISKCSSTPSSPIGKTDPAGISDVVLEAALTTIVDLEDLVAAVDAEDKLLAYSNWLGVIRGDLEESFDKGGKTMTRELAGDKWTLHR